MTLYPADGYEVGQIIPMEWPRKDLWSRILRLFGFLRTEGRDYRVTAIKDGCARIEPV